MTNITNYYQVTDKIACSGQPFSDQFLKISQAGFDAVINLSMPNSDNALAHEDDIVMGLGMSYVHIPIPWESPKLVHYLTFVKSMAGLQSKKVWVHCAMNMRASCMIYLYRRKFLGESKETAIYPMNNIWQPEGVWRELVEEVLGLKMDAA